MKSFSLLTLLAPVLACSAALGQGRPPAVEEALRAARQAEQTPWNEAAVTPIEPLYLRALTIGDRGRESEQERAAAAANNRAVAQESAGDLAGAAAGYAQAIALYDAAFAEVRRGDRTANIGLEMNVALAASNLGVLHWRQGDAARAAQWLNRAHEINERTRWLAFDWLSERQQTAAIGGIRDEIDALLSFHLGAARNEPQAARLALSILLQRKGRIAEALTRQMANLHERLAGSGGRGPMSAAVLERLEPQQRETLDPDPAIDRRLRDELRGLNARLAHLSLAGPGRSGAEQHQLEVGRVEAQQRSLHGRIGNRLASARQWEVTDRIMQRMGVDPSGQERRRVAPLPRKEGARWAREQVAALLHSGGRPAALSEVQAAIPPGAALVEFAAFRTYLLRSDATGAKARGGAAAWGPRRYVAYVLLPQGEPALADLGDAALIERNLVELRRAFADPQTAAAERAARALDELLMRPVRKLLGSAQHVFLSPDGALHLIPFAALRDENERHLLERFQFTYLTSGRDLLALQNKRAARQGPTLFADVDFGPMRGSAAVPTSLAQARRIRVPRSFAAVAGQFEALPGTAEEARGIQALFPDARVLTQRDASESALKQLSGPRILHLATHGFYLEDAPAAAARDAADAHPLLQAGLMRSGLLLADANTFASADDDGVLTALEAAGLDLLGTKLVVLSACETGIGEVHHGEGVYGLRRAFAIAGAETLLTSLWKVDDDATRDLMIDYYRRLRDGAGRSAALREAQLKLLADRGRSHPFFWAAFITSGDWRALD